MNTISPRRCSRRSNTSDRGSALVELAVCLPLLALTLVGTADFARVFYRGIGLTNAARAGAQYGAYNLAQSGNTAVMQTTASDATNLTGVTAVASRLCQCASDAGAFSATLPSPNSCTVPVATSCPGLHRVMTVNVTTTGTFTTISGLVGVPHSVALSRTATLQVSE